MNINENEQSNSFLKGVGKQHVSLDEKAEEQLGSWYGSWSSQAAHSVASANGMGDDRAPLRGAWLKAGQGPLFGRRRGQTEVPYAVIHDPVANLWSGAINQMKLIEKHLVRGNDRYELNKAAQWLEDNILHLGRHLAAQEAQRVATW